MGVTNWHYPADCNHVNGGSGGTWNNPENSEGESGFADGNKSRFDYLSSTPGAWLRCVNFGFSPGEIPVAAGIAGIEVNCPQDGDYAIDGIIKLRKSSGQVGDNKADTVNAWYNFSGPPYKTWGGEGDDWNAGITRDDILAGTFGIDISTKDIGSHPEVSGWVDGVKMRIWYFASGLPAFIKGDLNGVFGKKAFLLGSLTGQLQYFGWILGNPVMQSPPQKPFLVGDVITAWGKKGFLQGSLNPYYGAGGYIVGTLTAIPYYPKPIAGSWFQRTGAVIEKIS